MVPYPVNQSFTTMKTTIRHAGLMMLFALFSLNAFAQTPFEVPLWEETQPPVSNGLSGAEITHDDNGFTSNVSIPGMTVYPARTDKHTGMAILIIPGGGYGALAMHHEGRDFALWLAENGITGIVLKYRLPNGHRTVPLDDAQQAMRLIRKNAQTWQIDQDRVGAMGFSAGGHLASTLLTHFDAGSRPDFGLLFYPVVSFDDRWTHKGSVRNLLGENPSDEMRTYYSNEKQVSPQTPPTLILYSDDDKTVMPVNGAMFYEALKAQSVPAALYIFPSGGHGWGFNTTFRYHDVMTQLVMDWLGNFPAGK